MSMEAILTKLLTCTSTETYLIHDGVVCPSGANIFICFFDGSSIVHLSCEKNEVEIHLHRHSSQMWGFCVM